MGVNNYSLLFMVSSFDVYNLLRFYKIKKNMYTKCKICSGLIKKKQGNLGICNGCRKKIIESESKEKDIIMLKNKHIANKLEKNKGIRKY